jgi:hypothetical protein
MNCPVCNRTLASTLSICPSCGAMMNDSVREELEIKATPTGNLLNQVRKGVSAMQSKPNQPKMAAPPKPIFTARDTGELLKKPASPPEPPVESAAAPTLVEFQNKNATLPDWRLKMQNAVRQRIENPAGEDGAPKETQHQTRLVTSGANALKPRSSRKSFPNRSKTKSGERSETHRAFAQSVFRRRSTTGNGHRRRCESKQKLPVLYRRAHDGKRCKTGGRQSIGQRAAETEARHERAAQCRRRVRYEQIAAAADEMPQPVSK